MHSKSDNIKIMMNNEADEVINGLFDSLKNRYQNNQWNQWKVVKVSEFDFDYVHLLFYKYHKINSNCGGSYIDSPDWIKTNKKTTTTNPINKKDNKCFQYAGTVA